MICYKGKETTDRSPYPSWHVLERAVEHDRDRAPDSTGRTWRAKVNLPCVLEVLETAWGFGTQETSVQIQLCPFPIHVTLGEFLNLFQFPFLGEKKGNIPQRKAATCKVPLKVPDTSNTQSRLEMTMVIMTMLMGIQSSIPNIRKFFFFQFIIISLQKSFASRTGKNKTLLSKWFTDCRERLCSWPNSWCLALLW